MKRRFLKKTQGMIWMG